MMIVVNLQFEGFHHWPKAPVEHAFLRSRHRHMFHVRAGKRVTHGDREIEIIDLKRRMQKWIDRLGPEFGTKSCEQLAEDFVDEFDLDFCSVMEDGENGALVTA